MCVACAVVDIRDAVRTASQLVQLRGVLLRRAGRAGDRHGVAAPAPAVLALPAGRAAARARPAAARAQGPAAGTSPLSLLFSSLLFPTISILPYVPLL